MILMIIKGLFRRYERWNPVHPTSGAFWGMGIGIGCGVGWGPGFGPEVIGYVGAGCGVGFSVGITLAGVGIGLPANCLIEVPYNAFIATRNGALEFTRMSGLLSMGNAAGDGLNNIVSHISGLQREASGRFSSFKGRHTLNKGVDLCDSKSLMLHSRSILERIRTSGCSFFHGRRGLKD
ncbi:cadmium-induced protein AS8 isoform X2 [Vitis vinifera]|nr:cadmium-induced protein AS8 isoform X2 [Vitis vinifera]|eukprot:XP_010648933.1 PREDICTED: cadmium-induced protein AS8 isoform X1 [Vitis vinifera]